MNARQTKAVDALQRAITRCQNVGLSMAGIDDDLVIFRTSDFTAVSNGKSPAEVINEMDYVSLEAPYIDSGAS